ncbi:hypothetical protein B9W62_04250 [Streptomyces sp. CS113]|uniref:5-carboxymethyl-2-hydroxymuconate Delta-isomerase n=1 Tax=Streptomyces sp. CS113 TaxID=1982761 RepID=UPI000B420038|nr:5-carboxymethyl-2-hydroxymuconate delta isomerase [Streptomyces sp. CS113]OWA13907.1 hypothetical protein B9W62_04250 [Streptomyces sp. CS113]
MPHLTVDYSIRLAAVFDRAAFVRELHPLVIDLTRSAGVCKTFFRAADACVHDGSDEASTFVHVEIGLLPGRSEEVKARLSDRVLALTATCIPAAMAPWAVLSVEVRDLSRSYRLRSPHRNRTTDRRPTFFG